MLLFQMPLIVAEEVLADIKTLIAAEAHSVRMARPTVSIPLSDAQIAILSVLKRLEMLPGEQGVA